MLSILYIYKNINIGGKALLDITIDNITYKNFLGDYWVSNYGHVARILFNEFGNLKSFFLLEQDTSNSGHKRVEIKINSKPTKFYVHRMVYIAWVGPIEDNMVIEHLDGNPSNNFIGNLKQSTQSENIATSIIQGNFHNNRKAIYVYDIYSPLVYRFDSVKDFLISINAPQYMINHGGVAILKKRREYDRYRIEFAEK